MNSMENLKTRLIVLIEHLGTTKSKFEKYVGLSNGFVDKSGPNTRRSSLDKISIAYPNVNVNWILTGEGQMLVDSENISQSGTQNIQQSAKGSHITQRAEGFNFDRVLALLEKNAEQIGNTLEKKDEQMDKLLEIIANLSKQ